VQAAFLYPIVRINKPNILSLGCSEACITGHTEALILLIDEGDIGVPFRELLYDVHTMVLGAVVDYHQFIISRGDKRLTQTALQTASHVSLYIIYGDN
jgi:hypothetical protein